jgi:signal peptidase II
LNKYIKLIIIVSIVILFDQISKRIILAYVPLFSSINVIPGFFDITHLQNPGGAFSFLANQSVLVRKIVFLALPFAALFLLFYFYKKTSEKEKWFLFSLALIIGGACGNLIDRFLMGKVVDFLDFYIKNMHWPPFNIADSAILVGMVIFAGHIIIKKDSV